MNKIILIGILILMLPMALGVLCADTIDDTPCNIITPKIYCSTNATITAIDNSSTTQHPMTEIDDGVYTFSVSKASGSYYIKLCDGSTKRIESGSSVITRLATIDTTIDGVDIKVDTLQNDFSIMDGKIDDLTIDLGTVDSNVDAVLVDTGTTLPAQIVAVNTTVQTILADTNELQVFWAETTGDGWKWLKSTYLDIITILDNWADYGQRQNYNWFVNGTNEDEFKANVSSINLTGLATQTNVTAVITQGDSAWTTATGFSTSGQLDSNITQILNTGNANWTTADVSSINTTISNSEKCEISASVWKLPLDDGPFVNGSWYDSTNDLCAVFREIDNIA